MSSAYFSALRAIALAAVPLGLAAACAKEAESSPSGEGEGDRCRTPEDCKVFLQGAWKRISAGRLPEPFLARVRHALLQLIPERGERVDLSVGQGAVVPITLQRVLLVFSRREEKVAFYRSIVAERPAYEDQLCTSARILLGVPAGQQCP